MTEENRSLEYETEVIGTPEEVWAAIATSGGISSWYVPHTVEEQKGGTTSARFGIGPEMEVPGRVAAWDPPNRVLFDGGETGEGLAFEWLVEARDGGSCVVRMVNTGFGSGAEWDAMYDGMAEGWKMFLRNLQLHLELFAGQTATASLPGGQWQGDQRELWDGFTKALGIQNRPTVGQEVHIAPTTDLSLVGRVAEVAQWWFIVVLDKPAPGTAIIALELIGDQLSASVWTYLYGEQGAVIAKRDEPKWQAWMDNPPIA